MHDKRKKYNGGISPRYIFYVGARGITMRNDTITGHHHPATMLSVTLLCRDNASHHNAIPLLDQIEQDMALTLRTGASHCFTFAEQRSTIPLLSIA
jgi:hypothetical protein